MINSRAKLLLIGSPVAQSLSPVFQNAALKSEGVRWTYGLEDVDRSEAIAAIDQLRSGAIAGLNVTMPHKELAAQSADVCDERVVTLGVANTLFARGGLVHAANTDVDGVRASVRVLGGEFHQAAVLGAGGAAAAAVLALALAGVDRIAVISRSASAAAALVARVAPALASSELVAARWGEPAGRELVRGAELVVNATPLGMGDEEGALQAFGRAGVATSNAHLLDLIYARRVTPFLSMATSPSLDGATMLVEQGAASWEIWTGRPAPRRVMYDALFGELGRSTPLWVGA